MHKMLKIIIKHQELQIYHKTLIDVIRDDQFFGYGPCAYFCTSQKFKFLCKYFIIQLQFETIYQLVAIIFSLNLFI